MQKRTVDEELLRQIVRDIVARFQPRRVILFGSRARGDSCAGSDIDLFIEWETSLPKWQRRVVIDEVFGLRDWAMDLVVLTPEEVARAREMPGSLVRQIEREGKVLYERP